MHRAPPASRRRDRLDLELPCNYIAAVGRGGSLPGGPRPSPGEAGHASDPPPAPLASAHPAVRIAIDTESGISAMGELDQGGNRAMKAGTGRTTTRPALIAFAASVALASLLSGTGAADASSQPDQMAPNSILAVDGTVGAQLETPADGRLRGYGFTAQLDSIGTAEAVEERGSPLRAAAGQRLVVVALRFNRSNEDRQHPVRATLVVEGRRTSLPDSDFVRSGELLYAASVPRDAAGVDFELAAAGYAQTFSLTEARRVGEQPAILYRDRVAAEPSTDLNAERTVAASDERQRGAVRILLRRVRLSWFSPAEPVTTPPSPDQAFLILEGEGDGVPPPYGSDDFGRYFSDFEAMPVDAVTATLPDGASLTARHGGSTKGLLGGAYYFTVPASLGSAKVSLGPATVPGSRFRGFIGERSAIRIEQAAQFDLLLPQANLPAPTPVAATPTTTASPSGQPPPTGTKGGEGLSPLWLLVVAGIAALGLWWRRTTAGHDTIPVLGGQLAARRSSGSSDGATQETEDDEEDSPVMVLGLLRTPVKRIEGPGAVAAVRAGLAYIISSAIHDPCPGRDRLLLLVAQGDTERLLPPDAPLPPWVRILAEKETLFTEIDVAHIRFVREREDNELHRCDKFPPVPTVTVVMPGPQDEATWKRLRTLETRARNDRYALQVICVGGEFAPWIRVEADGRITTSDETLPTDMHAWMLSEAEVVARLAREHQLAPKPETESPAPARSTPEAAAATSSTTPDDAAVTVRLLGLYTISAGGREVATGLRSKARELLAYLAVNRDGATADAVVDALFPDTTVDKGQDHFRTVVANLRTVLRSAAGLPENAAVVERVGPRYRLDARLFAVDLWRFEDALTAAANGDEAAAWAAVECYRGDFVPGEDYVWAEPPRERLRRKAIDHLTALAARRRHVGDLHGALRAAERAIELDPYAEELYRTLMALQQSDGRPDAARRTHQLLEHRLKELGVEPNRQTTAILNGDREPTRGSRANQDA